MELAIITLATAILLAVALVIVLIILQLKRFREVSKGAVDPVLFLNQLEALEKAQQQIDWSVRDEISRSRQEQSRQGTRWKRGGGTSAASFSTNSPSLMITCVMPSRQDTSSIPGGEYQFAWRLPDFDWQYYPIAIR